MTQALWMAVTLMAAVDPPVEQGAVTWLTSMETAQRLAQEQRKPLLILFDEIPGCSTVQGFGREVLSHPLIADAMQHAFVPLLVRNNVDGDEKRILEQYGEPAWNNPVIRIVGTQGRELTPRFAGPYTVAATARLLVGALLEAGAPVPGYLAILMEEETVKARAQTAVVSMYCFWEGEARVGGWNGVVSTEPGFTNGHEVVRLTYDPKRLTAQQLDALVEASGYRKQSGAFQPSVKDEKYQLQGTGYRFIPLTPMQRMRLNAHHDPDHVLSPTQQQWLKRVEAQRKRPWVELLREDNLMVATQRFLAQ